MKSKRKRQTDLEKLIEAWGELEANKNTTMLFAKDDMLGILRYQYATLKGVVWCFRHGDSEYEWFRATQWHPMDDGWVPLDHWQETLCAPI